MIIKYFLLWLPMIVIAFANATIRQLLFIKYFNELGAHQLSTVTLIILCFFYIFLIFPFLHIQTGYQALLIGALWVVLTIIFEFALGRLTNNPWPKLLQQYDITSGHIWPLFLLCLLLLPYLCYGLKK